MNTKENTCFASVLYRKANSRVKYFVDENKLQLSSDFVCSKKLPMFIENIANQEIGCPDPTDHATCPLLREVKQAA